MADTVTVEEIERYGDLNGSSRGMPHQNGATEQSHFRTATAIEQALLLRGERDFVDEAGYLHFQRAVVDEERNAAAAARPHDERRAAGLQQVPARAELLLAAELGEATPGRWQCGAASSM